MPVVQEILLDRIADFVDNLAQGGKVKINGEYVEYKEVKTSRSKHVLRKYIYLDNLPDDANGKVEEAQLIGPNNEVLAIKPFDIQIDKNGIVVAFEFKFTVQEG